MARETVCVADRNAVKSSQSYRIPDHSKSNPSRQGTRACERTLHGRCWKSESGGNMTPKELREMAENKALDIGTAWNALEAASGGCSRNWPRRWAFRTSAMMMR